MKLLMHLRKAYDDTFMPNTTREQRRGLDFTNYFLGYPEGNTAQYRTSEGALETRDISNGSKFLAYFYQLRFLLPILNSVRRPVEFVFNLGEQILDWAEKGIHDEEKGDKKGLGHVVSYLPWSVKKLVQGITLGLIACTSPSELGFYYNKLRGNDSDKTRAELSGSPDYAQGSITVSIMVNIPVFFVTLFFAPPLGFALVGTYVLDSIQKTFQTSFGPQFGGAPKDGDQSLVSEGGSSPCDDNRSTPASVNDPSVMPVSANSSGNASSGPSNFSPLLSQLPAATSAPSHVASPSPFSIQ